jgi:hypothetical protein
VLHASYKPRLIGGKLEDNDAVDARVEHTDEQGEGLALALSGKLTTGSYKGRGFRAL